MSVTTTGTPTRPHAAPAPDTVLPVTAAQRSLLFIQEAMERKDLYNISFRITFDGVADESSLRRSLTRLLRVQPALRTEFALDGGVPRARLTEPADVDLETRDVTGRGAAFAAVVDEESRRFAKLAVDLRRAPLCRFALVRGERESALLCNIHHSVSDGVSMTAFLDELREGYRSDDPGAAPGRREQQLAAELAAQVRATDAALVAGEVPRLAAAVAAAPATTLYPTPTRPVDTSFAGGDLSVLLTVEERRRVEAAARELSVTPFGFLLACYSTLLGQYAGQDTVVVGSPFSTRRTIAAHELCGFFVNTLPLVLPAAAPTFDEHCTAVAGVVREAMRYQAVPFDALVAEVAPERVTNRNPLFQCMFAMQDTLPTRLELAPGLTGTVEFVSQEAARFDLWLGATPVDDGLLIELEYDTDLLPAPYAERFLAEYRQLVLGAADEPRAPLRELTRSLDTRATAGFRRGHEARVEAEGGLLGLAAAAAGRDPDHPAVVDPGGTALTYRELLERTRRAAAGLSGRGVRRGHVVAVVPDNLADTVVAMLAVLWCGAAYLPIDTGLPADRLSYMLDHADCTFMIANASVVPGEPERATVTELEQAGATADAPEPSDGSDPVYIMFTSGSTGRPKGVLMGQPALVNLLHWQLEELAMGPATRFLQFAPLGFDVSYQEIFPTLAAGGTVYGLGPTDRRDLRAVAELVDRERLTHVYLPVAVLGAFAAAADDAGHTLRTVSFLCVSGEQLHLDSRSRRLLDTHDRLTLVNLYGPTETHAVTWHVLPGGPAGRPSHVPIGRTLPGVDTHLLGPDGQEVPPGAVGELHFGGVCPAQEYVNSPERTEAAFLPAPGGGRMYRTGDLAVRAEDGDLLFLGRRDSQVKLRGHRVELGELETAAERLPAVRAAAATVRGTGEQAALCLFVLPAPGEPLDVARLRDALRQDLPTYMIPRHVLRIDLMPLTANGKVDRVALLRRYEAGEFENADERPATGDWNPSPAEATVRELWTRILGNEPTGPEDSFFVLGGNSFDVMRLLSELAGATGVRVAVADFFRSPTLGALAAHLDTAPRQASAGPADRRPR
ncbi:amino acid adenylation domain-containing protein [Streptomyces sp. NBC_01116]|uniref:non-ribosomal peptide synthetase n=1 Tax=Streptomyces sp. NBC_01116 TaxID=2903752 RepID=UPI00324AC47D